MTKELRWQMQLPRLSSFTVIGAILIFIGVFGMTHGPSFQYDLGVQADHYEGLYYLVVGALMIVNGFFWLPAPVEEQKAEQSALKGQTTVNNK